MRLVTQFGLKDQKIKVIDSNGGFFVDSSYLKENMLNKDFIEMVDVEDQAVVLNTIKTISTQTPVVMATHRLNRNFASTLTPLRTIFCLVFGQDCSEGDSLIQSVTQVYFPKFDESFSQCLVNTALQNVPDLFFRLSTPSFEYIDYFTKVKSNLYVQPDFFLGKKISHVLPEDIAKKFEHLVMTAVTENKEQNVTYPLEIEGELKWFEARFFKESLENSNVIAIVRDITTHKNLENKLNTMMNILQAIIDESQTIISVYNQSWESILSNKIFSDYIKTKSEKDKIIQFLESEDEKLKTFELALAHMRTGEIKTFLLQKFRLTSHKEASDLICLMGADITDRIEFERKLQDSNLELLRKTEMLEVSREIAEKAVKAKSTMMASLSHEIRTPLHGIIGTASLISETLLTSEQREAIGSMQKSGQMLLQIINDLLDISKFDCGKLELSQEPLDLIECVEAVFELLAPLASDQKVSLTYCIEKDVPSQLIGDEFRLRQVLLNLASNGIKFSANGWVHIKFYNYQKKVNSNQFSLGIVVQDNGEGIPQDKISLLFQPFSQVSDESSKKFGGTGLGLAICKRLAQAMEGDIWVESEIKKGSSFTFVGVFGVQNPKHLENNFSTLVPKQNIIVITQSLNFFKMIECMLENTNFEPMLFRGDPFNLSASIAITDSVNFFNLRKEKVEKLIAMGIFSQETPNHIVQIPIQRTKLLRNLPLKEEKGQKRQSEDHQVTKSLKKHKLGLKILIVEDNKINQQLLRQMLIKLGCEVSVCDDGTESIELVKNFVYDIIFMDLNMSKMNGIEATQLIRSYKNIKQPIIIAVTANVTNESRQDCHNVGMDSFLSKPFRTEDLHKILHTYFNIN